MRRTMNKRERLKEMARYRREHVPSGYKGIGEYHDGAYECDFVSPYTKSAQNLDADIMLILQDWCGDDYLRGPLDSVLIDKGHDPGLTTNQNVKALLRAHFGIPLAQTYATNLFPFIKPGKMTADVPPKELAEAARTYTVPEIEVVEPKLVVCCGSAVYRAIRKALGLTWAGNLEEAIESPFRFRDTEFWGQSHGSQRTQLPQPRTSRSCFARLATDVEGIPFNVAWH